MTQKLNITLNIKAYSDSSASSSPSFSNFNWNKQIQGSECSNAKSESIKLNSLESKSLHNGVVALSADNTTTYDISLAPTGQYMLSFNSGTPPVFRTKRVLSTDATTTFVVSRNANVLTYSHSAGTAPSFSSTIVGDILKIDAPFNVNNRGYFQVIAKSTTSVSVVNYSGAPETVLLNTGFDQNFKAYSAGPLIEGQTFNISSGFSSVTLGSYVSEIVEDDRIFFSAKDLPLESDIQSTITAYSSCKTTIYIESSEKITLTINGNDITVKPTLVGCNLSPGVFLLNGEIYSLSIANNGIIASEIFYASVEA